MMYLSVLGKSFRYLKRVEFNVHRNYHSENVFGFKRKNKTVYKVPKEVIETRYKESNFYRLALAYRQHGHKCSNINPVSLAKINSVVPELEIERYGFSSNDNIRFGGIINSHKDEGSIEEAVEFLKNVYCKNIAAEYLYVEDAEEIEWLSKELEKLPSHETPNDKKFAIGSELLKSQSFDNFLAKKFTSLKRYGGEGAESMLVFFSEIFQLAAEDDIQQIVLAMPHRGRLNLLTGILNFPPVEMFTKLKGYPDFPEKYQSTGDVLSHCISSTELVYGEKLVHVTVPFNPSHLEAINPVSMGKTRAKQMMLKDGDYGSDNRWSDKILNIQVHGDAAIIGQGINQECLSLSGIPHFEIGGSVHLVVNNQVGFTTPAERGRSSRYATDLAKVISAPVIHVNGDYPEDVLKVAKLAFAYQRKFRKEIFIDLNCYRRWGHNELDDPTFTNPSLYSIIRSKRTVPDLYAEKLLQEGVFKEGDAEKIVSHHQSWLSEHLKAADHHTPQDIFFKRQWEGYSQPTDTINTWDTGLNLDLMTFLGIKSVKCPPNFEIHPTLLRAHIKNRISKISEGIGIDWSTAEGLAIGSLLFEGYNVRISGQDVGRGTFSQRHVMLVDQKTNNTYIPLNNLHPHQTGFLEVANSILSEEAVLGFEYGVSIEDPRNLVIWEAQFGDFFNGAQIIFDTFISSGEAKWIWQSGITILLPHGYDGAGPEHSSSRIERFLQMTNSKEDEPDGDNINMQICQPSTPAQYFHLLRRQMIRNYRKPLIVITPKTLLRHSSCTSDFSDMVPGTYFKPVIGDTLVVPSRVKKVLLTSGKHYYSLKEKRESMGVKDTAIIRVESFCPFPTLELRHEISKFPNAKVLVWCQEEPQNMGSWSFMRPRFENLVGKKLIYCGRGPSAAPAVGVKMYHEKQVSDIINKPFLLENER
ncbi:probable 2-oxoadipate dehydrogenase complex component E1 homolog [Leptinotarsa decemlineata]|uniref:probable 2-oxoadipate dehydrogenase complex component E1 homolog n=1 Tax=Leptinotarsa decemlineata TaxID=7539 RepID=UPI003D30784E